MQMTAATGGEGDGVIAQRRFHGGGSESFFVDLPEVTVAVVVKDRRDAMLRCLAAVLAQDYPSVQVVVVDNGSVDGTPDAIRDAAATAGSPVHVEVLEGTLGAARNRAVELAKGEVVAFTDSDCAPEPGWLRAGVRALLADPGLGVVQGCTLPPPGEVLGRWAATQHITAETLRFECCNVFYRLDALRATAGFDDQIGFFGEDTAAGWYVRRDGWRSGFVPDAIVYHDVTHPGLAWHLRRAAYYSHLPALVRTFPEMRDGLLWKRWFVRRRDAEVLAFLAGAALAPRHRWAALLTLPYLATRVPERGNLRAAAVRGSAEGALFDIAMVLALGSGSVRHRRLVL